MISYKTFGCKVNTYDTGLLQKKIKEVDVATDLKVHVVNTCAVTREATKEALRHVRKLKRDSPESKVVVTGCSAQVDGGDWDALEEVDLLVANSHKSDLPELLQKYLLGDLEEKIHRSNIFRNESLGSGGGEEDLHTRSFLKIQDGCNSFCSFCIIPYARGKSRSLTVDYLLQKINEMVLEGTEEVVLTGIHIGGYIDRESAGGPYSLADLVEQILLGTEVKRLRLGSLEPIELNEKLMSLYANPRLCPHFHMSIQSVHTRVLKDMKRNYTSEQVANSLNWIAKVVKNPFVGMDVIVGFPGETAEDFAYTYDQLANLPWTRIHVFPYSERPGTRAAISKNVVPWVERKERAKKLRALSDERFKQQAVGQLGDRKKVLTLKSKEGLRGISRDYWPISIVNSGVSLSLGSEVEVTIKGYDIRPGRNEPVLTAELIDV